MGRRAQLATQHCPRDGCLAYGHRRPAKKASAALPLLPRLRSKQDQHERWEARELDEIWTLVGRKKRTVWLGLAVERASRRIVAWVMGRRDAATARRFWQALPRRYWSHCWYFTDLWESYVRTLPRWRHRRCPKGDGGTGIVEAINGALRQRCGAVVCKSCSFSKSLSMHTARIKIVGDGPK